MDEFLLRLRAVNATLDRGLSASVFGKSSLQPLVALLKTTGCTPLGIYRAIAALEPASVDKYRDGLSFLLRSFPGLSGTGIQLDDLRSQPIPQVQAALYTKSITPADFNPDNRRGQGIFVKPPSTSMGRSIVKYLLANPADAGLLMIHLGSADSAGLDESFNGRTSLQYMTSVLRVARMLGCPITALSMAKAGEEHLCPVLLTEFMQVPKTRRLVIHEPAFHTATNQPAMLAFLRSRPRVIVMGFDATICVFANVFGSEEKMSEHDATFRPPLINFADVVMSRATLACKGPLNAKTQTFGKAEYGPLFMLGPN
ncbi:hypothetical protein ACLF3G_08975 [Falsiroseomonas sp. HC035]|uniref:hypothetical protein n=1 Tax=Falsiroseomonas sp. HC035 TaxID=3390999 RepID=UPI003D30F8C2